MRKIEDFDKVKEATNFPKLEPGPQIVKIVEVIDVEDKEYLQVHVEIAHGDLKGEFQRQKEAFGADEWPAQGILRRSYKKKALPFFKRFIVAVEKSNEDFKFDFDEQKLVGRYFVANYGIEEYDNGTEIKESIKIQEARSVKSLKEGNIEIPKPKRLSKKEHDKYARKPEQAVPGIDISEDDLPF